MPGWALQAWLVELPHLHTTSMVLSGEPSQSLSAVEVQSRAALLTAPTHAPQTPPAQVAVPGLQIPMAAGPHAWVSPLTQGQPSFGEPLQFESSPLTVQSSLAAGATLHVPHLPPAQVCIPLAQLPSAPPALQRRAGSTSRQ